ncbi:MAG: tyrosine-protein phosphatase [Flavobacteriales bacterium]
MFGLFRKKPKAPLRSPLDAKLIGVDIHSHLIAGIDDGAQTHEESLALVKGLKEFGFKSFWTSPHVMSDFYRNSSTTINEGAKKLNDILKKENIDLPVHAAAEYYFDDFFFELIEKNDLLPIRGEYLLFEFSYINQPEDPFPIIKKIKDLGYKPLLAHPERYPFYFYNHDLLKQLRESGVYFQININSLAGHYGPESMGVAHWMIDQNIVDFVGTDIHKETHLAVIERALCSEYLYKLVESGRLVNQSL